MTSFANTLTSNRRLSELNRKSSWKRILETVPKNRHEELNQVIGSQNFKDLVEKNRLDFIDILEFLKIELKLSDLLELSNKIAPRFFTIASSNKVDPETVRIILRVETFKSETHGIWNGLFSECIREIQDLDLSKKPFCVNYSIQESTFKLPHSKKSVYSKDYDDWNRNRSCAFHWND